MNTDISGNMANEIVTAYEAVLNGKNCIWLSEPDARLLNMNEYPFVAGLTSLHMINSNNEWTAQFRFYDFVFNNHISTKSMPEAISHFLDVLGTTIRVGCATEAARVAAVREGSASSSDD